MSVREREVRGGVEHFSSTNYLSFRSSNKFHMSFSERKSMIRLKVDDYSRMIRISSDKKKKKKKWRVWQLFLLLFCYGHLEERNKTQSKHEDETATMMRQCLPRSSFPICSSLDCFELLMNFFSCMLLFAVRFDQHLSLRTTAREREKSKDELSIFSRSIHNEFNLRCLLVDKLLT